MPYVFESGEAVDTGSHGETDYVFVSGEPLTNSGESSFVFESGTGIGGQVGLTVDGVDVGVYVTDQTSLDFVSAGGGPDTTNLVNQGVLPTWPEDDAYTFVYYSTADAQYNIAHIVSPNHDGENRYQNSADYFAQGGAFFIDAESPNYEETDADGDWIVGMRVGGQEGDIHAYSISTGSYSLTVEFENSTRPGMDLSAPPANVWNGPNGSVEVSYPGSFSVNLGLSVGGPS